MRHLHADVALKIVFKALQVKLQDRREVAEQVADLGVLQRHCIEMSCSSN